MPILKAFLIDKESTTGYFIADYLVNLSNLPAFLSTFKEDYEIVVVGQSDLQFVLKVKEGQVKYCSMPKPMIKKVLKEMRKLNKDHYPVLQLFQVFRNGLVETVKIYSDSSQQAYQDFNQWSKLSPDKIVEIA